MSPPNKSVSDLSHLDRDEALRVALGLPDDDVAHEPEGVIDLGDEQDEQPGDFASD